MLNNVTFGQFYPGNSIIHRLDPRFKLILTFVYVVFAFVASNFAALATVGLATAAVMILSGIPAKMYMRTFKAIWFFIAITLILNVFYIREGELLLSFWVIRVYSGGLLRAFYIAFRIVLLLIMSSALTYTTTPNALTDAIESLLTPLAKMGADTHTFAMMMTIALRFIPTLIEETSKIMNAQKARGANMDTGSIIKRVRAVLPVLIPLLASSIRRATELADAMECRCYSGGKGRTRMKVMKSGRRDYISLLLTALVLAGIITLNILF